MNNRKVSYVLVVSNRQTKSPVGLQNRARTRNPRWEPGMGMIPGPDPRQIGDGDGDGPPGPLASAAGGPGASYAESAPSPEELACQRVTAARPAPGPRRPGPQAVRAGLPAASEWALIINNAEMAARPRCRAARVAASCAARARGFNNGTGGLSLS
jgi:hypothetical protein